MSAAPLYRGKPVVVIDWGWLRALPSKDEYLSNVCRYMIPDVLLRELLNASDEEKRTGLLLKLRRVMQRNPKRILLGRYWQEVSSRERNPTGNSTLADVVSENLMPWFRSLPGRPISAWLGALHEPADGHALYEEHRQQFSATRRQFATWAPDQRGWEQLVQLPEARLAWLRNPARAVELVVRGNPRMQSDEWRKALSVFPDRLAAGRWGRLVNWACLEQAIAPEADYANDWDDISYAFLASYAGQIVTLDRRLRDMCNAVFPHVAVTDWIVA